MAGSQDRRGRASSKPTASQLDLLRALAEEPTMTAVATRIGRSPRQTRRLVTSLLAEMGVGHVRAAIALAVSQHWIMPRDPAGFHG